MQLTNKLVWDFLWVNFCEWSIIWLLLLYGGSCFQKFCLISCFLSNSLQNVDFLVCFWSIDVVVRQELGCVCVASWILRNSSCSESWSIWSWDHFLRLNPKIELRDCSVKESEKLLRWNSILRFKCKRSEKELFRNFGDFRWKQSFNWVGFENSFEVRLSFSSPWCSSRKHLIEDDTNGPDITFEAVNVVIESFIRHIDRWANIIVFPFFEISLFDRKPKISNLQHIASNKNIRRLQIPMHNIIIVHSPIPIDNLPQHRQRLTFSIAFPLLNRLSQILTTQLSNDIDVVFGVVDVVNSDDVRLTFQLLK